MAIKHLSPIAATLLFILTSRAQQSPNPQPFPVQTQTLPCVTAPSSIQKPQSSGLTLKPPSKLQQYLDNQKKKLASKYGLVLPDTPSQIPLTPKPSSQPCPPQTIAVSPALKLSPTVQ